MKKLICFLLTLTCFAPVEAQINDSFNAAYHFPWQGDTAKFTLLNAQLNTNSNIANDRFHIAQSANSNNKEWHLDIQLSFNTSSANFVDFYLAASSQDLENADTALFIKIGNTKDEISLYQRINGSTNLLIDGIDEVTKKSSSELRLIVKLVDDTLSLDYATSLTNPLFLDKQKVQLDTLLLPTQNWVGVFVKQSTASFFGKHFFDNLYAGQLIGDTVKPKIQSAQLNNGKSITLYFNESIAPRLLQKLSNFSIVETGAVPVLAETMSDDSVRLTFSSSFGSGVNSTLKIDSLQDLNNNVSLNQTAVFNYLRVLEPHYKSLIITEIFAKPGLTGLQAEAFELYNGTDEYLTLAGCQLFDLTADEAFPAMVLAPKTYYVVCDDADTSLFNNPIPLRTMPSLNDATDLIRLENMNGFLITQLVYKEDWHTQGKENGGWSLEMKDVEKGCYIKENFGSSIQQNGHSLGSPNSINGPLESINNTQIERLYLPNSKQLEVFWNSPVAFDVLNNPINYQFTPSIGMDSILADKNNPNKVTVFFTTPINGSHQFRFSSFTHCSGATIAEQTLVLGSLKVLGKGDLQITEILFNSETGCSEFIEVKNVTDSFLDLKNAFLGISSATKSDQLNISTNGIMLAPHQILVLAQDKELVQSCHQVCKDAIVLELKNWSTLDDKDGNIWISNFTNTLIDSVEYSNTYHSSLLSDENGVSLEKIDLSQSGMLARVWSSTSTDREYATPGCENTQLGSNDKKEFFSLGSPYFQAKDQFNSKAVIQYKLDQPNYTVQMRVLDRWGLVVKEIANNELLALEGNYFWDGLSEQGKNCALGIYYIQIVAIHPKGNSIKETLEVTKLD